MPAALSILDVLQCTVSVLVLLFALDVCCSSMLFQGYGNHVQVFLKNRHSMMSLPGAATNDSVISDIFGKISFHSSRSSQGMKDTLVWWTQAWWTRRAEQPCNRKEGTEQNALSHETSNCAQNRSSSVEGKEHLATALLNQLISCSCPASAWGTVGLHYIIQHVAQRLASNAEM